ncbi:hypothetical protein BGZ76_003083 [Entomortierella beljakovae]|nr:hypothetical protein BGZ76_003083 [Entomortierella beljakovae]
MPSNKSQSSSQDSQSSGASQVHFTTAELKDSLRPSSILPPNPSPIRGNAARLRAKNTKENSQQQQQRSPPVSSPNSNTNSSTILGTPKSKVLRERIEFVYTSNNNNNSNSISNNKRISTERNATVTHLSFLTQEWSRRSNSISTREPSSAESQLDQSPIVSDLTSAFKSQEHIEEGIESLEEIGIVESTLPSLPSSPLPPQLPPLTQSPMASTRSRRNKRVVTPEPTTFSQLISGQRIPSVSQSTEEKDSTQGIDSQLYHSTLTNPIIDMSTFSDEHPIDPDFSPTTTSDTYESLVLESSNDLNNPFIQTGGSYAQSSTPVKTLTRSRSRQIANSKDTQIVEHVIAVELPPVPAKVKAAREADRVNKSEAKVAVAKSIARGNMSGVKTEAAGGSTNSDRSERRTSMQLRKRDDPKTKSVKDSPSKHTRSQDVLRKSSNNGSRRLDTRSSRRVAALRLGGAAMKESIESFSEEDNDAYTPESTDDGDVNYDDDEDDVVSGGDSNVNGGDDDGDDGDDDDGDDDDDDDDDSAFGLLSLRAKQRSIIRRSRRLAEVSFPAKRPKPPTPRIPSPRSPSPLVHSSGNLRRNRRASSDKSNSEEEIVPPKKRRWRGDLNHPLEPIVTSRSDPVPNSPTFPIIESTPSPSPPLPNIPTTKNVIQAPANAPLSSPTRTLLLSKSAADPFTSRLPSRIFNSSTLATTVAPSLTPTQVRGINLKGLSSARNENNGAVNKKLITEQRNDPWDLEGLERLWIKNGIQWPMRDGSLEDDKPFKVEPYSVNFIFGTALPLPEGTLL